MSSELTLAEFLSDHDFALVHYTSIGQPLSVPDFHLNNETEYPFDLDEITGRVADGVFTATDVGKSTDYQRNDIQMVWSWVDEERWKELYYDWLEGT